MLGTRTQLTCATLPSPLDPEGVTGNRIRPLGAAPAPGSGVQVGAVRPLAFDSEARPSARVVHPLVQYVLRPLPSRPGLSAAQGRRPVHGPARRAHGRGVAAVTVPSVGARAGASGPGATCAV